MMDKKKLFKLYSHLPVWTQNVVCSLTGLMMKQERYNKNFRNILGQLNTSQWWAVDRQKEYQNAELKAIVKHAYDSVPYYKETFQKNKIHPEDITSVEDLKYIPILSKSILRERYADLQSAGWPTARVKSGNTGGTTGTALKLSYDRETIEWQWAIWWRHRNRFNVSHDEPYIAFAGRDVVPLNSMDPPFWRRNFPMNQTYVSIHHLSRQNMPILAEYLCSRKVTYYSGYPSSLYLIARYLHDEGIHLPHPPKIVFTGAETLLPHQRHMIQLGFNTIVSDQYGASEYCGNISECENFKYHVDFEFGIIEFLPIPGMPENIRRIVCTGFKNPVMPLIRYDIGDIATLDLNNKCSCGRCSQVVEKIDGRIESYIITPDGRQLGRLDFLFKKSKNIVEAQLLQNEIREVVFKIVKNDCYSEFDERDLLKNIHEYMGTSFRVKLEYVSSIPKEKNGKFRQIVSTIVKDKYFQN